MWADTAEEWGIWFLCSCCSSALFNWLQVVGRDLTLFTNKSYLCYYNAILSNSHLFHQHIYTPVNAFTLCLLSLKVKPLKMFISDICNNTHCILSGPVALETLSTCCFQFSAIKIPLNRVVSYYRTRSSCPKPAIV